MKYYSATNRNELLICASTLMDLKEKKSDKKMECMLSDSVYIKFWKVQIKL